MATKELEEHLAKIKEELKRNPPQPSAGAISVYEKKGNTSETQIATQNTEQNNSENKRQIEKETRRRALRDKIRGMEGGRAKKEASTLPYTEQQARQALFDHNCDTIRNMMKDVANDPVKREKFIRDSKLPEQAAMDIIQSALLNEDPDMNNRITEINEITEITELPSEQ